MCIFEFSNLKDFSGALSANKIDFLKKVTDVNSFIETGTYLGDTTHAMRTIFDRVISIELSDKHYSAAVERFGMDSGVTLVKGDSANMMDELLAYAQDTRPMIWLDAHWSGGDTARANENTPIMSELESIRLRGGDEYIILIDDIRNFIDVPEGFVTHEAHGGYPSLIKLLDVIASLRGNYRAYITGDVLVAMPQRMWNQFQVSQVVVATMALRLNSSLGEVTCQNEEIVANAIGEERETLLRLPDLYANSLLYGIGGYFCYWRGLILEREKHRVAALADFMLARRCGIDVPKRLWEKC